MRILAGLLLLIAAALLVVSAWCLGRALGAPAPVYRPPVPLERAVLGHWTLAWGSMGGAAVVSPQGFWGCCCAGVNYHGSWECDGDVLTVRESRLDDPSRQEMTYRIVVGERKGTVIAGQVEGGVAVRLER